MTSNIGSQVLLENVKDAGEISDDTESSYGQSTCILQT